MDSDERQEETPQEQEPAPRSCRITKGGRCLPCIPCHVFSIAFFVLVLVVLWIALRG